MVFRIRLISACRRTELCVGDYHYSSEFAPEDADALLCEWAPHAEILSFSGPKAWYCCEPTTAALFQQPEWRHFRARIRPEEFLFHAHPDNRFRVPHTNLEDDVPMNTNTERFTKAVAIISNAGSFSWRRSQQMALRARFATHPQVDLYGQRKVWETFRDRPWGKPEVPSNYRGELEGFWTNNARFETMAGYKVAVCLENTCEPYYFTEKMVGAARAGCIPIYRAHSTVRETFLVGAKWVDPADFGFDAGRTLNFALCQNLEEYQEANRRWLQSAAVQSTHVEKVFQRIGDVLSGAVLSPW